MQALFKAKDPRKAKLLHVMSSGIKAAATWSRAETMQHCRECCGGQGFLAANKIGPMKNDMVRMSSLPSIDAAKHLTSMTQLVHMSAGLCASLNSSMDVVALDVLLR